MTGKTGTRRLLAQSRMGNGELELADLAQQTALKNSQVAWSTGLSKIHSRCSARPAAAPHPETACAFVVGLAMSAPEGGHIHFGSLEKGERERLSKLSQLEEETKRRNRAAEDLRRRKVEDVMLSAILAVEDCQLRIKPFGQEWQTVELKRGDLLIFR